MQIPKCDRCPDCGKFKFGPGNFSSPTEMSYHSSWDWLIPVIEKIETENYGFKMCRKVVEVYFDDTKQEMIKVKLSSRMESAYKAVTSFIDWYNIHQPKP